MQRRIHMHDQVFNKVDDIMNHYKRKPIEGFIRLLKKVTYQYTPAPAYLSDSLR